MLVVLFSAQRHLGRTIFMCAHTGTGTIKQEKAFRLTAYFMP